MRFAVVVALTFSACLAREDHKFIRESNPGSTVIVLVSGLGGGKTWPDFIEFIKKDTALGNVDIFSYESPLDRGFEQNVERLVGLMQEKCRSRKKYFVGHSMGGFIAKSVYLKLDDTSCGIATIGTPLGDKLIQTKLHHDVAFFFSKWFTSEQNLKREVYNTELLTKVNMNWRNYSRKVEDANKSYIFARDDDVVLFEASDKSSIGVEGDHMSMLHGKRGAGTYAVLRKRILAFLGRR